MMEQQDQLKLQAYLDGELSQGEARQWEERLKNDAEASALLNELRQTRQCLTGFEEPLTLPESRDFYWSKIRREITRESAAAATATPRFQFGWLRRILVPASGLALLVFVGLLTIRGPHPARPAGTETALADSGAFTYHDYAAGATLVWLSYPAEKEVAVETELGTLE